VKEKQLRLPFSDEPKATELEGYSDESLQSMSHESPGIWYLQREHPPMMDKELARMLRKERKQLREAFLKDNLTSAGG
jgi:hypothetical protein